MLLTGILIVGIILAAGCITSEKRITPTGDTVNKLGTISFVGEGGGFYGINADDGNRYEPINLSDDLKVDGKRVAFTGMVQNIATTHMWGIPLEITHITAISAPLTETEKSVNINAIVKQTQIGTNVNWILVDDAGNQYTAENLPERFQVDGSRVFVSGTAKSLDGSKINLKIQDIQPQPPIPPSIPTGTNVVQNGTIMWIEMEGGFYGIIGDNGIDYLPLNLNSKFMVTNTRIRFEGTVVDTPTIYMWGLPVNLTRVVRV
ncbi:MAG: hypothetical protein NTW33_02785 [Methanoregula sp.]|nr:hypothetical protein [Methanoregula sp.]